ncbi:peptide chain release factor-like protein [bacterium]|nr:peptide chain release factor-like protein [bacterium]
MTFKKREKLFSVTKKDLKIEYFSGTGPGGQARNKNQTCVRIKHPPSGAVGLCQDHKKRTANLRSAFSRMVNSDRFQRWVRIEAARVSGETAELEKKVDKELANNVKEEVKEEGKWTKV